MVDHRHARLVRSAVAFAALVTGSACAAESEDQQVSLDFFQFKPEAIGIFDELIADFEAEHPTIRVVQNHVPDADTAIRVRMVREDIPDVMTLNGNFSFGELASAGVFHDFSGSPLLEEIRPAVQDILNALGTRDGEVNGIPFANNANGIIYNKDLFAEYDVEVPTTWDELVEVIDTFENAGVQPFYQTLGEPWTSLPAWNALAGNEEPEEFFAALKDDQSSFQMGFDRVAERLSFLFDHGQPDSAARDYNTGNQAFAREESAMYLQGVWAIPSIRSLGADFEIGVFPYPADSPDATRLVSGVDAALTMGREPDHPEESMVFIEYLLRPDVVERYVADQSAIPTIEGLQPTDPALEDLVPYFERGQIVGFSDHQIPPSIPLPQINQQFLLDDNQDAYLQTLDNEWEKYARRRL